MTAKFWNFLPDNLELQSTLSSKLGISDILASLLVKRVGSYEHSLSFLNPQLKDLSDPFLISGMKDAVALIRKGIDQGKKFLVYGDYDVDGVSSTVLLLQLFKLLNAQVDYYIPNRVSEGYSITPQGLQAVIDRGTEILVTVDNGISAVDQIKTLRENGIDVIVTDHHEPPEILPPANVLIDPKLKDCPYPFKNLAGVGVAFKLAWATAQEFSRSKDKVNPEYRNFLLDSLAWVALGTVTDLVPLVDENRVLAKFGIPAIHHSTNPGLQALCEISRNDSVQLTAEDISYRIGPKINAAGRMGQVDVAVRLFLATERQEAVALASQLETLNRERQAVEREIFVNALERTKEQDREVLVMADEKWHPGVIGIVASRLVDEVGKPAILVALDRGVGKGSCRSIQGLDIYDALTHCSKFLEAFGGHSLAGGFQIREENIAPFQDYLCEYISGNKALEEWQPSIDIDCEIFLSSVNQGLLSEIDRLRPFGEGNPVPIFVSSGLKVSDAPQTVGRQQNHLVFRVREGNKDMKAIAFGQSGDLSKVAQAKTVALAYTPKLNTFYGRTTIQIEVKDIKAEE